MNCRRGGKGTLGEKSKLTPKKQKREEVYETGNRAIGQAREEHYVTVDRRRAACG